MSYLLAFFVCGFMCLLGQIIYDNTKFTPGHITSLFGVVGSLLDVFGLQDKILNISKVGASLPITSFGHSLMHAANEAMRGEQGLLGVASWLFNMTATGITSAILFAFLVAIVFKPKS